jgi:hypothetical protein
MTWSQEFAHPCSRHTFTYEEYLNFIRVAVNETTVTNTEKVATDVNSSTLCVTDDLESNK